MTIIVRQSDGLWTVEVDGKLVGEANTEANAEALVTACRVKPRWVASWRFCEI